MKKTLLLLNLMSCFFVFSQSPTQKIQNYLDSEKQKYNLTSQDVSDWVVESTANSTATNINNYYIKQRHQGIEVFSSLSNVWYKNDAVIGMHNSFVSNLNQKINTNSPVISVGEALTAARNILNDVAISSQIIETVSDYEFKLSNGNVEESVNAELVYHLTESGNLRLAWDLNFYTQDYKHLWSVRIDAVDAKLLDKQDWVISCNFGDANHKDHNHNFFFNKLAFKQAETSLLDIQSGAYRVFPFEIESPNHGARQLLSNPHNTVASPFGWHDTNGVAGAEFTITRGNNVWAQEDANGNNGTGASPDGGATLSFDFPYGGTGVAASTYLDAATTNLFYMNNMMHDVWYQYGFNEANGNFQQNNYNRGTHPGVTGDAVFADSQDGSGTNNANFSTPVDGTRPRMQMFLWDVGPRPKLLTVNAPTVVAGQYDAANNAFDPGNVPLPPAPGITSDLVLYSDATPDTSDACETAVNGALLNGKIVILRRGTCPFAQKVLNAQAAGAIAVIVVNNDTANPDQLVNMSGADASITIPAIFVSYNVGEALIAQMGSGTVNVTLKNDPVTFVNSDGDFDNVVIAHEYGHGISTRLAGGPANSSCLSNAEQMGEGWSDFFGLMMQMKAGDNPSDARGIGTFVVSQPTNGTGIRSYPYSVDMGVNPFTFTDTNTEVVPHGVGSVWATVLWDLAWAYVDKYGFDPDKFNGTGGNNKVMRLVLDGLKLQPCNPTFVTGRNALIAADQATTGGADYCMIWEVFARRGLGVNASSGSGSSTTDQVEDFTTPSPGPNCTLRADYFSNEELVKVYPNPTNGLLNIAVNGYSGELNVMVYDLNGRQVFEKSFTSFATEQTINLQGLQTGMYILKLEGDGVSHSRKVILN
jgi:extracellular elastinolytic metalloproteinase